MARTNKELERVISFVRRLEYALRKEPATYQAIYDVLTAFDGTQNIAEVAATVLRALQGKPELMSGFIPFLPDELYDSLEFVNKVRDHFGGTEAVAYRSFLDLFGRLRQGGLSQVDAVQGVEALLRDRGGLLEEFRTIMSRLKAYEEAAAVPRARAGAAARPPPPPPPRPGASSSPAALKTSKGKAACSKTNELRSRLEVKMAKRSRLSFSKSVRLLPPRTSIDDEHGLSCNLTASNHACASSPQEAKRTMHVEDQ